eukprot:Em0012g283a
MMSLLCLTKVKMLCKFLILLATLCAGVTAVLLGLRLMQQLNADKEAEGLLIGGTDILSEFDEVEIAESEILDHFTVSTSIEDYGACGFGDTPNKVPRYSSIDKHVILRSVFWDPRPFKSLRRGFWVFLAVAEKHIVSKNLIIGVQVGNDVFYGLDVRETKMKSYINRVCPKLTHGYIVVRCNAPFSYNSSHAALLYKTEPNGVILSAVSENRPIVNVMPQRSNERKTIVSCLAPGYGNPRLLPHWIRYERTIGVSHIHVIADQSFVESGALNTSVVKRALETGFLSIAIWPRRFTSWQVFYREQVLAYQDCVHRFQGLYDYVFPHDVDDFFVPLIPGAKLDYYVNTYCTKGTCSFQWEEITPPNSGLTGMIGRDGNVTDKVAAKHSRTTREARKSIHKLEETFEIGIHEVLRSSRWFPTTNVPSTAAYVAHIRY